tara:strand:+ start:493 stop:828 length:336 start_codon:yes stop_codon:yes gene_type:complete
MFINYRLIYVLQKDGKNNTRTAKISSLPNNIAKDNIHFAVSETLAKFPLGPIMSPRPGPTFDIDVAAPEIADKKSRPEIDSSIDITKNNNKYEKIKITTEFINVFSTFCLL